VTADPDGLELLEVGRVARAHGVRGELLLAFTTDLIAERTATGAVLMIGGASYLVESARPHKQHHLVHLSGVRSREDAEALRGLPILAERREDSDAVFVHEVIGLHLVDQLRKDRDHGPVVAVINNPASDLMELGDGRLVPFAFLIEVDARGRRVTVDVPAGLLED
jgi:16S rRNA processing protein RimM